MPPQLPCCWVSAVPQLQKMQLEFPGEEEHPKETCINGKYKTQDRYERHLLHRREQSKQNINTSTLTVKLSDLLKQDFKSLQYNSSLQIMSFFKA